MHHSYGAPFNHTHRFPDKLDREKPIYEQKQQQAPLSNHNVLFGAITWETMHVSCLVAGLVGLLVSARSPDAYHEFR